MRKFKLYNHDRTSFIDLNSKKHLVDEVTGLGFKLRLDKVNNSVHDFDMEFEDITLRINFGIDGNAYFEYNKVINFIALNGKRKLILEYKYRSKGVDEVRYCDLYLKSAPKKQKNTQNIIQETFVFERVSVWYKYIKYSNFVNINLNNQYFLDQPVNIKITEIMSPFKLILKKPNNEIVQEIEINETGTFILYIDSENKKILKETGSGIVSAYDIVNKNKNSFMQIPPGQYILNRSGDALTFEINIKEWQYD